MSSTNKTSLGLNMWEASDKPVRQDFVNDNVIIDEKMTKLNSDLQGQIATTNSNLVLKADKASFYTITGTLTENLTQIWNLTTQNSKPPYLLAAQIQLDAGVWSDMRTLSRVTQIAANSVQMALTKDAADSLVGYQVRFLFMVG